MLNILFKCLVYFTHLCNLHWFFAKVPTTSSTNSVSINLPEKIWLEARCLLLDTVWYLWCELNMNPWKISSQSTKDTFSAVCTLEHENLRGPHQSILKHQPFFSRLSPPKSTLFLFKPATSSGGTTWFWSLLWNLSVYKACLVMVWLMLLWLCYGFVAGSFVDHAHTKRVWHERSCL